MKPIAINIILFVLVTSFVFGCSQPSRRIDNANVTVDDFLFTVEWCGPQSKPVQERGFASERSARELQKWVTEHPFARQGAILSTQECRSMLSLIENRLFAARRSLTEPNAATIEAQYMAKVRLGNVVSYYLCGTGEHAASDLQQIKSSMEPAHGMLLDDIIAALRAK